MIIVFYLCFTSSYNNSSWCPQEEAEGKRSLEDLGLVCSTDHLSLIILSTECDLAQKLNYDTIINVFATKSKEDYFR